MAQEDAEEERPLVLVVDDDPTTRILVRGALEPAGYAVEEAEDGAEALSSFEHSRPDIVLLDVNMPGMDGFAVCAALRARQDGQQVPVMMVTGLDDHDSIHRAYEIGATDFVTKPINLANLGHRVRYLLRGSRLQQELREREEEYRTLFENLQDVFFRTDTEGNVILASPSCEDLLGYSPQEICELNLAEDLSLTPGKSGDLLTEIVAMGRVDGHETALRRMDGSVVWVSINARLYRDGEGRILGVEGMARDVTKHRQAEEELARLATAVTQAAEAIIITDTDGNIQYANPSFSKISGYGTEEVLGRTPSMLKSGEHDPEFYRDLWDTLTRGEVWSGGLINQRKNGATYEEECQISPVRDASGNIANYVAVKRDVTKERQLERQLSESQKMEALGTLAGGIAHDFNNILTPIMGYSELALDELPEEGLTHDWVEQVLIAAARAKDIVGQILTFSRRSEETREIIALAPLIDEVLKLIRPKVSTIEIRQHIRGEGHTVVGDPGQLHQLLVNLCTNATQAIGDRVGTLEVHLDNLCTPDDPAPAIHPPQLTPGDYVRLTVRDSGCGMPREVIERIFEPFYTTKDVGQGTGLGLAVAHGVVKQLGGAITVESTPGKGTTFRVFLPAGRAKPTPAPEADEQVPTGSERILLVDDEAMVLAVIQATLEGLGYRVIATASADDAIEKFRSDPGGFDLVITDNKMPGMLGTELTRAILAARADTPVVLTTGFDHTIDPETVRDLGVRELIMKPMAASELGRCVRRALDPDEVPMSSATTTEARPEESTEWLTS